MTNDEMKNIEDVDPNTVEPGPGNNPVKRKVTAVIKQEKSEDQHTDDGTKTE